jgi:ABC-type sulfate transport system permease component
LSHHTTSASAFRSLPRINSVFGVIAAWVHGEFPGRKILDAIVDLPSRCRRRWQALR